MHTGTPCPPTWDRSQRRGSVGPSPTKTTTKPLPDPPAATPRGPGSRRTERRGPRRTSRSSGERRRRRRGNREEKRMGRGQTLADPPVKQQRYLHHARVTEEEGIIQRKVQMIQREAQARKGVKNPSGRVRTHETRKAGVDVLRHPRKAVARSPADVDVVPHAEG